MSKTFAVYRAEFEQLTAALVQKIAEANPHLYQRDVENKLQNALKFDRARVQLGRISKFGLLEMSRQRLRPSLGESSQLICPRCEGHGRMRSIESLSLSILRVAEEHAMKENTGQVLVQVPVEIANYLLNEKRRALSEIEQRHDAPIVIVADDQLETPHYEVTRVRENEMGEESSRPSYQRGTPRKVATIALTKANLNVPVAPAVTNVSPTQPAPIREPREETPRPVSAPVAAPVAIAPTHSLGMVERILRFFRGTQAVAATPAAPSPAREGRGRNDRGAANAPRRDGRGRPIRDGQRRDEQRLGQPRHPLDQQVAAGEQRHQHPLEQEVLADDGLLHLVESLLQRVLPVGARHLAAQSRRWKYLPRIAEAGGVERLLHPVHARQISLGEDEGHVVRLLEPDAVLARDGAAHLRAHLQDLGPRRHGGHAECHDPR